jgi:hypothetical protein
VYSSTASAYYTRSGKAQQSIIFRPISSKEGKVYMGVNYGQYLEHGTGIYHTPDKRTPWFTGKIPGTNGVVYIKGMKPRPFWNPAIKETKREIKNLASKELSNI